MNTTYNGTAHTEPQITCKECGVMSRTSAHHSAILAAKLAIATEALLSIMRASVQPGDNGPYNTDVVRSVGHCVVVAKGALEKMTTTKEIEDVR